MTGIDHALFETRRAAKLRNTHGNNHATQYPEQHMTDWRFWRKRARRIDSDTSLHDAANSDTRWVNETERSAARYGYAAHFCAWVVVVGVLLEYGDEFLKLFHQPTWTAFKPLIGGVLVALGVAFEVLFGAVESKKEGLVRDWHQLRIAELSLEAERLRQDNLDTIALQRDRCLEEYGELVKALSRFSGMEFCLETIGGSPADNEVRESRQFAFSIINAVRQAGWVEGRPMLQSTAIRPNVHLTFIKPEGVDEEYNETAETLAEGINAGNAIAFTWYKWRPDRKVGSLIISVGHKPGTLETYRLAQENRAAQVKVRES